MKDIMSLIVAIAFIVAFITLLVVYGSNKNKNSALLAEKKSIFKMKNKSLVFGRMAIVSPIPLLIVTSMWSLLFGVVIGMGVLHYDTIPNWMLFICLLPLAISPILGLAGIFCGITKIKEKMHGLEYYFRFWD